MMLANEGVLPAATRTRSVVVIGADALLAAHPATPVQLAHACMRAGYEHVVPASWGDELVATATLHALESHGTAPAVQCSCPLVAARLLAAGDELRAFLVPLVSPPAAVARYLRALHAPGRLRITYVGSCPGGADPAIDARLRPEELLAAFSREGVELRDQPLVFDSIIPPDRRRYRSLPGGLPTADALWSEAGGRSIAQVGAQELAIDVAQLLLSDKPVLVDAACALGCYCSGAVPGVAPTDARARVIALEPPRSRGAVVDEQLQIHLQQPLPVIPTRVPGANGASAHAANDIVPAPTAERPPAGLPDGDPAPAPADRVSQANGGGSATQQAQTAVATQRRHSPARGVLRPLSGAMPTSRDNGGRQLPRSYVARRRAPARAAHNGSAAHGGAVENVLSAAPELAEPAATPAPEPPHEIERAVELPVTPRSDARAEEGAETGADPRPAAPAEPPSAHLMLFALLICATVLVSAAIGVMVGHWLEPR